MSSEAPLDKEEQKPRSGLIILFKAVDIDEIDASKWPEWVFTSLSFVLAVIAVWMTGYSVNHDTMPPSFMLTKDLAIYGTLLILTIFFFMRYRQVLSAKMDQKKLLNRQLEDVRNLVSQQVKFYHDLMSNTKSTFFHNVGGEIYENRFNYATTGLNGILENSLNSVVSAIAKIMANQFSARKERSEETFSLAVKARVTGNMARSLCQLSESESAAIRSNDYYVITLARDHNTRLNFPEREVRKKAYALQKNTEFLRIDSGDQDEFLSNDLETLAKKSEY